MSSWGELFIDLKTKKHFPNDGDYVEHIIKWFKKKVFKKEKLSCTEQIWVKEKFALPFRRQARALWKDFGRIKYKAEGGNDRCEAFLTKTIDVVVEECTCDVCQTQPMDVDVQLQVNPCLELVQIALFLNHTFHHI